MFTTAELEVLIQARYDYSRTGASPEEWEELGDGFLGIGFAANATNCYKRSGTPTAIDKLNSIPGRLDRGEL